MLHLGPEVLLGNLFHLAQNEGGDLLGSEHLLLALNGCLQANRALRVHNAEGQAVGVPPNGCVVEAPPNEPLDVEECLPRVLQGLVLCGFADEPARVREGNHRGGDAIALLVRDNLHLAIPEDANAREGGS
mmetsp:Transcript_41887/g.121073  ORF Transcript_41887/g.121073 Transcript_41887/m.121073 type:complete len:131 (-) Transcript_41887:184-576(-)